MKYEKTGNYENDMRNQKADNDGKYYKPVKAFAWLYALKNLDKIIVNIILAIGIITSPLMIITACNKNAPAKIIRHQTRAEAITEHQKKRSENNQNLKKYYQENPDKFSPRPRKKKNYNQYYWEENNTTYTYGGICEYIANDWHCTTYSKSTSGDNITADIP